jgi:hypothetical protein
MTTTKTTFVVIAIFKNETIDMKEWIEHYIWQGASHIYLADNESTDSPLDILQPYIDAKYITYVKISGNAMQLYVYYTFTKIIQELESPPDWICVADLDEFWFGQNKRMDEVLADYPETVYVVSRGWREFGPSEDGTHPPSLRKYLVYRNPEETSPKYCFRTLRVKPENVLIHGVDGVPVENMVYEKESLHIHHYFCRSAEYWNTIKIPRGYCMGNFNVYACENTWRERSALCTFLDTNLADRIN